MIWFYYILAFLAGCLLGAFFIGGLWWTVQKVPGSSNPYLFTVLSFFARTSIILAGFYLIIQVGWLYLLITFAGFITARTVLTYRLKSKEK